MFGLIKREYLFRISKKPKGFIVEIKKSKWRLFGIKKVWCPFVKTSGLDEVWHHSTVNHAYDNFISEIKKQTEII